MACQKILFMFVMTVYILSVFGENKDRIAVETRNRNLLNSNPRTRALNRLLQAINDANSVANTIQPSNNDTNANLAQCFVEYSRLYRSSGRCIRFGRSGTIPACMADGYTDIGNWDCARLLGEVSSRGSTGGH